MGTSPNSAQLSDKFQEILNSFFPRYLLRLSEFKSQIEEIRVEGHTSSEWAADSTALQAYFENMRLSQERTRTTLQYSLSISNLDQQQPWARDILTANGLSSSKTVKNKAGLEIPELSRRVEFRVKADTEQQIQQIIKSLSK